MTGARTHQRVDTETLGIALYGAGVALLLLAMFLTTAVIGIRLTGS